MSESKSPEEMLAGYIEKMGQELGELFRAASSELIWTHWRWQQYRTLFGEEQSRIDLLNEAAPFFFRIIQNVLFEDTVLAIARLVGPPNSVGRSNLTIQRFPLLLTDQSLRDEISLLIEKAKTSAAFAVEWRNRRLAHRDLDLALGKSPQPPDPATREKVEESLSALRAVLQDIEWAYCVAHTAYYSPTPGDAEALLSVIRGGLLRESEKRERWNRGEFRDEDTKTPEAI